MFMQCPLVEVCTHTMSPLGVFAFMQFVCGFSFSLGKFDVFLQDSVQIYQQFRKDRQAKKLSYNEEQIHKMDKSVFYSSNFRP